MLHSPLFLGQIQYHAKKSAARPRKGLHEEGGFSGAQRYDTRTVIGNFLMEAIEIILKNIKEEVEGVRF